MSAARARGAGAVDALLDSLPALCFVVGKGGVGKTTCAAGLTACFAARGERTLLVSTDPAGSLGAVLGISLPAGETTEYPDLPGSRVLQIDARSARQGFLARWRDTIVTIMDRGTYLDTDDIEGLVDAAFPGADEIFGLLTLAELVASNGEESNWRRIIVDTAPTGHTLRLLSLPETFEALVALLDAMQAKHRFMVTALTHRYKADTADEFLTKMRNLIRGLKSSLSDSGRSAAMLVTRAQDVVVNETVRYARELAQMNIAVAAIIVDALAESLDPEARHALVDLGGMGQAVFSLPRLEPPPVGAAAIRGLMARLRAIAPSEVSELSARAERNGLRIRRDSTVTSFLGGAPRAGTADSLLRSLTIVGGKGGVGKTTVACALALTASTRPERPARVLLVSTDPAPSIGDALGCSDPYWARRAPEPHPELPQLEVWQMDATTAFDELRDRYHERIDELFDTWIGRGIDASQDRAILRDLLALAPPGIDELYALSALGEIVHDNRYDCIVVDPAPTGHLLRLLEMPTVALDWAHRLMRLILKYREIAGLGEAAEELVNFSRRTRLLEQVIHDPVQAGVVLVSLDEPIVQAETARLAATLRTANVAVLGLIENRIGRSGLSHPSPDLPEPRIVAPESDKPLVGTQSIADWCHRWESRD